MPPTEWVGLVLYLPFRNDSLESLRVAAPRSPVHCRPPIPVFPIQILLRGFLQYSDVALLGGLVRCKYGGRVRHRWITAQRNATSGLCVCRLIGFVEIVSPVNDKPKSLYF